MIPLAARGPGSAQDGPHRHAWVRKLETRVRSRLGRLDDWHVGLGAIHGRNPTDGSRSHHLVLQKSQQVDQWKSQAISEQYSRVWHPAVAARVARRCREQSRPRIMHFACHLHREQLHELNALCCDTELAHVLLWHIFAAALLCHNELIAWLLLSMNVMLKRSVNCTA